MRKTLMLLFLLLISAAWVVAQNYPGNGSASGQSGSSNSGSAQSGSSSRSGQSQGTDSGQSGQRGQSGQSGETEGQAQNPHGHNGRASTGASKKVEGCLQSSNGSYTLTDNSGATYMLQGETSMLAEHVGHEVQITGTPEGSSAQSTGTIGGGEQTLQVKNVKHMAKACKSTGK